MAGLNPLYVIAPSLQEYFVDKESGQPLAGGIVTYYRDADRTVLKSVYEITGTPPNYNYSALPNPVILSAVGTIQDNSGNDVIPYYKPYDGNGNIDLYYITVTDSGGNPQFTREGWPNTSASSTADVGDFTNFVPNGQFLSHSNVVNTTTPGQITQASTIIAQGGWSFDRPSGTTAIDNVTFDRFNSYETNPTGNPRYAVEITCTSPHSGDTFKDLRLKFDNVNKFASATQNYRFAFSAISNSSGSADVQFLIRKYFGTGGSPSSPVEIPITSFTISTTYSILQTIFIFGDNSIYTLGTNDDDYVQLVIRFPVDNLFDISLTDFVLMTDQGNLIEFPATPDASFISQSIAGWLPTPAADGSDLYLPILLGPNGLTYDNSQIGKVHSCMYAIPRIGELLCDGTTYITAQYSPDGIPYSRLQKVLFNTIVNVPQFGTGSTFLTAINTSVAATAIISTNSNPLANPATDNNTGFTFGTIINNNNFHFNNEFNGYVGLLPSTFLEIYIVNKVIGSPLISPSAGTSGFTVIFAQGSSASQSITAILATSAIGLAGLYFLISSTTTNYYVWFQVNGVGVDPAIGGRTGVRINLLSTFNEADVSYAIANAFNNATEAYVTFNAGNTITAGHYFSMYANSINYYVWYKVDGVGTDPLVVNAIGIEVDILSTDTAAQVTTKTQIAINSYSYAVPNLEGAFLRGTGGGYDFDALQRLGFTSNIYGIQFGTLEFANNLSHLHSIADPGHAHTANTTTTPHTHVATLLPPVPASINTETAPGSGAGFDWNTSSPGPNAGRYQDLTNSVTNSNTTVIAATTVNGAFTGITGTAFAGTYESRPINISVTYIIKY